MTEIVRPVLGETYRDHVTGLEGVCTAVCEYYRAGIRVRLETFRDAKVQEIWVDVGRLENVEDPAQGCWPSRIARDAPWSR